MRLALIAAFALLVVALAGCASSKTESSSDSTSASSTTSTTGSSSSSSSMPNRPPLANLTAQPVTGNAPMAVSFTLRGSDPEGKSITWAFAVGDLKSNGTKLPATVNATLPAGNFSARLTVSDGVLATVARLNLTVNAPPTATERPLPDPAVFEFDPSAGCAGDLATCISREGGPDASGIDGFWLELTDAYWGFLATITETGNQLHDTDCQFYAPDASTVVGEADNGGESCTGVVPDGTGWMFLYSYAEPSSGMTLEFSVAPAE